MKRNRNQNGNRALVLALLLLAALALSACGGTKSQEPASSGFQPALDTDAAGEILVVGNYENFEALEAMFDDFNVYYPNVKLSYQRLDDYNKSIKTLLSTGHGPNIYMSFAWMSGREDYAEVFDHAENLADPAAALDLSALRADLLNREADGSLLQVPILATTYGMLVNQDLFEKEGLSVPTTYAELRSVAAALKDRGYESPMMGFIGSNASSNFLYVLTYPYFCASVAGNQEAVDALNALDPAAGEIMRPTLELVERFMGDGNLDLSACAAMEDAYESLLLRFFEGDVPMMICAADTVSIAARTESDSESFLAAPFAYTMAPIPLADEGSYFLSAANVQFSVNKDCDSLDLTNEFMRFLLQPAQLGKMTQIKGMLSPTSDLTLNAMFSAFGEVPPERTLSKDALSLLDAPLKQYRFASYAVGTGAMTIDEAVAAFGSLE